MDHDLAQKWGDHTLVLFDKNRGVFRKVGFCYETFRCVHCGYLTEERDAEPDFTCGEYIMEQVLGA